ncbi:GtrA family protein [Microbacterium sp. NPDC077184]|uniref:GtrA family protein n=1 Tax=Microbacterium sp. NPDC077184 TaxID=3154764 RepID=UPI0034192D73
MTIAASPRLQHLGHALRGAGARVRALLPEVSVFGLVGLLAFVVDVGGYNLLRATVLPDGVIAAKVVSVSVATMVAWIGHRTLTFRARGGRAPLSELILFVVANAGGLAIAAVCLFVSHEVLGFTSTLADNIAGNVVGLALGTAFRYAAYRLIVFRPSVSASKE